MPYKCMVSYNSAADKASAAMTEPKKYYMMVRDVPLLSKESYDRIPAYNGSYDASAFMTLVAMEAQAGSWPEDMTVRIARVKLCGAALARVRNDMIAGYTVSVVIFSLRLSMLCDSLRVGAPHNTILDDMIRREQLRNIVKEYNPHSEHLWNLFKPDYP